MNNNYLTIQQSTVAEYEINKSRFIAYLERIATENEAIEFIEKIKKKHWDARHNCSAYIIGEKANFQKADDDGEPSGTAGKPMLEVLKKNGLTDVVVVVTRYFGGIKLGAGGLIRAYGTSVTNAISAAQIVEKVLFSRLAVTIDYTLLGTLENSLHLSKYIIESKEFTDKVTLNILVPKTTVSSVKESIINWTSSHCSITQLNEFFYELSVSNEEKS
ncbi:YigZ family protein [Anaerosinus gibii]|uniref:YigZ family protein n=1 Tax=Selenobaculum gibii TaxID=3054208 RepID=A0A9Y2EU66_9FIRM|nr:YigZ family protein [Selenobaculum gbiensis]WIW71255.1 YigZ family protein [Selenobaculum gbiensis]